MKQSIANFVRALAVLLLFVPAPLMVVGTTAAVAEPAQIVAAEPAVMVPDAAAAETEDPWTARFLPPAVAIIAVVAIGASASYYIVRIRGRYRVVQ